MDKAYECLYDVKWQLMRIRLHEKWASQGGANEALLELLNYIGKASSPYWKFVRVWRVQNLLETVRRQYAALNKTGFKEDIQVRKAMQGLSIEYERFVSTRPWRPSSGRVTGTKVYAKPFKKWNWIKVKEELAELFQSDLKAFNRLLTVQENRLTLVRKKGVAPDMAELTRFVALIRDVVFAASEAKDDG